MEDRQLLAASLLPIANVSVPALQGYTVPLLASSSDANPQNYVATSSNPDIAVTIPQGNFWTVGVAYTDPEHSSEFLHRFVDVSIVPEPDADDGQ